jgi:hypothetical protein
VHALSVSNHLITLLERNIFTELAAAIIGGEIVVLLARATSDTTRKTGSGDASRGPKAEDHAR